jgi:hypothetical protein
MGLYVKKLTKKYLYLKFCKVIDSTPVHSTRQNTLQPTYRTGDPYLCRYIELSQYPDFQDGAIYIY